jgi:PAS domain S-box-containing protein
MLDNPSTHKSINRSESDAKKLIHELQVHQIELGMQNNDLILAKEQAEKDRKKYAEFYDFAPVGFLTLSNQGVIIDSNYSASIILGIDRQRLINSLFGFFVSDDTKPIFNRFLARVFNSKTKESCEVALVPDTILPVHILITGIVSGNEEKCILIVADITDRKQMEKALKDSEEKYRALFECAIDGIFQMTIDGKIIAVNDSFARMHGFTVDEIKTMNIQDLETPEGSRLIPKRTQQVMAGELATFEVEHFCKEGNTISLEVTANQVTIDGEKCILGFHRDITERKQAENLLQQTRRNYDTFFDTIDDFLWVLDLHGNIIHTNATVVDRLGYSCEELLGKSVLMVHPAERRDEAGRIVGEMLQGLAAFCPVPILTKSGVAIPVETRVSRGSWDEKPVLFGVSKDISQVRLSEEKFSKLFHLNPSACCLTDLENHKYIEVNDAFYALFGFDKNEVIGKTATDLAILSSETVNAITTLSDHSGKITNIEANLKSKNGDIKQVLMSAENIYVQDIKYRYTVVHDITRQKLIEKELRESEELFHLAFDNANIGMCLVDLEGRLMKVNEQMTRMFGYDKVEFEGMSVNDIADPEYRSVSLKFIREAEAGNVDHTEFEKVYLHKQGYRVYGQVSSSLIRNAAGEPMYFISHVMDITKRKQADEAICKLNETLDLRVKDRTRQLEESNIKLEFHLKEIEQFTYITSHDLSEPLMTLSNFTNLLHDEYAGKLDETCNKSIDFIHRSAIRMRLMLKDILDYSLLGKDSVRTDIDCNIVVLEVLAEVNDTIIATHTSVSIQKLPTINGSHAELRCLFMNLISNAIKFRNTSICPQIIISAEIRKKEWVFTVEDNGIGIREQDREKVFIIFRRMVKHDEFEGTGIGLALCKKIVELHGGRIWVESNKEGGSLFRFTIPV